MKLKSFRVAEFRSVKDSGLVDAGDITCLVGKNEAGKTALLKALYRLNPVVASEGNFDLTQDYPRMDVEDYRHAVEAGDRSIAVPIRATYEIEAAERTAIEGLFGPKCLSDGLLTLEKSYSNTRTFGLRVNAKASLEHLVDRADLPDVVKADLRASAGSVSDFHKKVLEQEETEEIARIKAISEAMAKPQKSGYPRGLDGYVYDNFLQANEPKYLYFDEYYQLSGHENLEALIDRQQKEQLKPSDHPLLGLVRLARLKLEEMTSPDSTIELISKLEGASNHLTKQVLRYWSQNRHLKMKFDVRPARPKDPEGMRAGTNLWGGVVDTRYDATTELGSRSRGFVWFFSFLAWYSDVRRSRERIILLLDEPGLTLHAKAQFDLLKYFEKEVLGNHQLIYTTHSPFMVDPEHFERVRVVQDRSIDLESYEEDEAGTQVLTDVFAANEDSLFPLQGALGYELYQTLFVGPYNLVVEGVADLLYLQTVSAHLHGLGRVGLDSRWTITPVGGAAKVPTFVALLGGQRSLLVATLLDTQASDQPKIEGLFKDKLLKKANVLTYADFTGTREADVEDMLGEKFYTELVNQEFGGQLATPIEVGDLDPNLPRVVQRVETHLKEHPLSQGRFSHFRPARLFAEGGAKLVKKVPSASLDRFEAAFKALNQLLPG